MLMQQQPRDIEKQKIGRTHNTAVRFCPSGPHLQHGRNRQRSGSRIWKKNTKMGATTASSGRRKVWAKARTRKPAQDRSCRKAAETEEESEEGGQEKARGKRGRVGIREGEWDGEGERGRRVAERQRGKERERRETERQRDKETNITCIAKQHRELVDDIATRTKNAFRETLE